MRPTLKEIAHITGYSIATVSRALNGSEKITPEAKRAVISCARKIGYRDGCRTVALIVPGFSFGGYFGEMLGLLEQELEHRNFAVEVVSSRHLELLEERPLCGAISVMAQNGLERYWGKCHNIPLVCVNTCPRHLDGIYTAGSNDEQAVQLAVEHLTGLGHRRIGRFGGASSFLDPENWNSTNRERAFRAQLSAKGLPSELWAAIGGATPSAVEAVKSLLDCGVTAIVLVNEGLELELLHALRILGRKVPQDVSLLVWTRPESARKLDPPLSGIEQDFDALVGNACEMFCRLLAGEPVEDMLVDYALEVRGSTAPVIP